MVKLMLIDIPSPRGQWPHRSSKCQTIYLPFVSDQRPRSYERPLISSGPPIVFKAHNNVSIIGLQCLPLVRSTVIWSNLMHKFGRVECTPECCSIKSVLPENLTEGLMRTATFHCGSPRELQLMQVLWENRNPC